MEQMPLRIFLSHTSELTQFPDGRTFVAAAKAAIERAGHVARDMEFRLAGQLQIPRCCFVLAAAGLTTERQVIVADTGARALGVLPCLAALRAAFGGRDLRRVAPVVARYAADTIELLELLAVARSDLATVYGVVAAALSYWETHVPPDELVRIVTYSL